MAYLKEQQIQPLIHYPIPVHQQPAFSGKYGDTMLNSEKMAEEILSLPIHPWLQTYEIDKIIDKINEFQ